MLCVVQIDLRVDITDLLDNLLQPCVAINELFHSYQVFICKTITYSYELICSTGNFAAVVIL
jgi:hypothetical protein